MRKSGFDSNGYSIETGTKFDSTGYDEYGYDREGYSISGFNLKGYNRQGFNREGYNSKGFDVNGIHKDTGTSYDLQGYDVNGFNSHGFNKKGFNRDGIHRDTDDIFDPNGFDVNGFDKEGFDKNGFDHDKYDKEGFHKNTGFNRDGIHKDTGTFFDPTGYDIDGYNGQGENKKGNIRKIDTKILYPYALKLVNYYLDSEYLSYKEMYDKEPSITEDRFHFLLNVIKKENEEKYAEIEKAITKKRNKRFYRFIGRLQNIITHIENGVTTPNGNTRNYEYFDLLIETKNDINAFNENIRKAKKYGISPSKNVYAFINKCIKRNKITLNKEQELNAKIIYTIEDKQVEVTKQQKLETFEYMKKMKLPREIGIYSSLLKNYVKGYINYNNDTNDIDKMVNESLNNNSESDLNKKTK